MITIDEIDNSENENFSTATGEQVSNLAYQIDCYSKQTSHLQASDSARFMGKIVNEVLGGEKYKMTRTGTPALVPLINDDTVMKYTLRYRCVLDINHHTIYKS